MDGLDEKLRFTIEEASELGLGSVRQIRYMIKRGAIQCMPPWIEGEKRQKRFIPRSELVRLGLLPSPAEINAELSAARVLELKDVEKHVAEIYEVKKLLESELWLPPLHYLPTLDLSTHRSTYRERTIYWTDSDDGVPIIKLPLENKGNFAYFKQHTESSEFWRYLSEWKRLGGRYIYNRSVLLNNIELDIQTETKLPIISKGAERGIFEGYSWVIYRHLFPHVHLDEEKAKELTADAISMVGDGNWVEAVKANRKIIKMFPGDMDALKRLGKALIESQLYVSAKEAYSRALEVDPPRSYRTKNDE